MPILLLLALGAFAGGAGFFALDKVLSKNRPDQSQGVQSALLGAATGMVIIIAVQRLGKRK